MLFERRFWDGLADGSVRVAFRWWKRPTVRAGGTLVTPSCVVGIDDVRTVERDEITEADAALAGYGSLGELLADLRPREGAVLHRIDLHSVGPDPRVALRQRSDLDDGELADVLARLERLDRASRRGPWTADVLALVAERPGVRAGDLAAGRGEETAAFKRDVRKLKGLGLTESLEVGYRLSPRGEVVLARLSQRSG